MDLATEQVLDDARVRDARLSERRLQVLARAQEARVLAKGDLDAARAQLARAHADMAAKVRAVDAPLTSSDRGVPERLAALITTWQARIALRNEPGHKMDDQDLNIARGLCVTATDDLGVVPSRLAVDIAVATAAAAAWKSAGAKVTIPYVGEVTVAELLEEARRLQQGAVR